MLTMEQGIEQRFTEQELILIEQGQMQTDLELKVIEVGGVL